MLINATWKNRIFIAFLVIVAYLHISDTRSLISEALFKNKHNFDISQSEFNSLILSVLLTVIVIHTIYIMLLVNGTSAIIRAIIKWKYVRIILIGTPLCMMPLTILAATTGFPALLHGMALQLLDPTPFPSVLLFPIWVLSVIHKAQYGKSMRAELNIVDFHYWRLAAKTEIFLVISAGILLVAYTLVGLGQLGSN